MNKKARAGRVTAGLYEFFCSAAAGHRAMLDAEYFILLYTLAKDVALNHSSFTELLS